VSQFAQSKRPDDYVLQKKTYDRQTAAKHYMSTVTNREVSQMAQSKYPNDYVNQKIVYDTAATK
jgi:hypothetical protein